MLLIQNITDASKQKQTVSLPDGSLLSITMEYKPMQTGWFITELKRESFTLYNLRVVASPNMLHQFRNLIPFGLACFVDQNREPTLQQDFSSAAAKLYILTADEVKLYGDLLSGEAGA